MATAPTSRRFPAPWSQRGMRAGVLLLAGAIGFSLTPSAAQAAPSASAPTSSSQAAALVAARAHDLEAVTEQYNTAKVQFDADQAAAKAAAATLQKAQAQLAAAQQQVRGIARASFTGSDLSSFQAMLTSHSAHDFVDKVSTIQMVAGHQTDVLNQAVAAGKTAAQAQAAAAKAASDAKAHFDSVAAEQAKLQAQIADFQKQFNQLSAQEQRAAMTAAGSGGGTQPASRADRAPVASATIGPVVAPSQAAQIAVTTALAQRGKPYVWAAAGPGSFDCSGLIMYSYAAAGIGLPHSAAMQVRMGHPVSRAQLQPGDLVGYFSPVSHIGMYVGNGMIINAPTAGDVVRVVPIDWPGSVTAMTRLAG